MEALCIGIIILGILVAAIPLIVAAAKVIGGCLLLLVGVAIIAGLAQSCTGGSSSSSPPRTDRQSASISHPTKTPLPRHTKTPRPTKTPLPTHTPTLMPENSARLAFRLLPPENVHLVYDAVSGGGTLHWDASRWMPADPSDENRIEYDITVYYPDSVSGPFITNDTSYQFSFLNAHATGGIRIEVEAVGIIKVAPYEYYRRSGITDTTWSPYLSESDFLSAVADHAEEVEILDVRISDNIARIEYKFISWLAVPNEEIAEEAAFKVICAVRKDHPEQTPFEWQLIGQGWHEDEYGRNFTTPTVEIHIPALAVYRINCDSKPGHVDWQKIASLYEI